MVAAQRRILVIGSGGFLGQHVLTSLLERGFAVSSLDLHDPGGFPKVNWLIGSITDSSLMAANADSQKVDVFLASNSLPGSGNADLSAEIASHLQQQTEERAELCCYQGDVDLPDDKMKATVTFEKNTDASLPASHTVRVRFVMQPGSFTGDVQQISVPQLRQEDSPGGDALAGVTVPAPSIGIASWQSRAAYSASRRRQEAAWLETPLRGSSP